MSSTFLSIETLDVIDSFDIDPIMVSFTITGSDDESYQEEEVLEYLRDIRDHGYLTIYPRKMERTGETNWRTVRPAMGFSRREGLLS